MKDKRSKSILVVDDEPVAREAMAAILRLEGYIVNSLPNGQAAVEYVRTHPIDLVITDLMMPGMNGLELIQQLKSNPKTKNVLTIIYTGFAHLEAVVQALRIGVNDFISKPAPPQQIINSIESEFRRERLGLYNV